MEQRTEEWHLARLGKVTASRVADVLAQQFYGDSSLWWIIVRGNAGIAGDSLACPAGVQIRIPANPTTVIAALKTT